MEIPEDRKASFLYHTHNAARKIEHEEDLAVYQCTFLGCDNKDLTAKLAHRPVVVALVPHDRRDPRARQSYFGRFYKMKLHAFLPCKNDTDDEWTVLSESEDFRLSLWGIYLKIRVLDSPATIYVFRVLQFGTRFSGHPGAGEIRSKRRRLAGVMERIGQKTVLKIQAKDAHRAFHALRKLKEVQLLQEELIEDLAKSK